MMSIKQSVCHPICHCLWMILLCLPVMLSGQQVIEHKAGLIAKTINERIEKFDRVSLFGDPSPMVNHRSIDQRVLQRATFAEIKKEGLAQITTQKPEAIQIQVPFNESVVPVKMYKVNVLAEGFYTSTSESNGQPVAYTPGVYYRGIIEDDDQSIVALSFFEDEVIGMISSEFYGNITLNKEADSDQYLIYSDRDLLAESPIDCHTEEPEGYAELVEQYLQDNIIVRDERCIKVYIECDYALYVNKGSVTNVNNYISAVFNNVATLYANEQILTQISTTYVWTTSDPYSKTSSSTALNQFRNNNPSVNGDLAHLAALGGNNIGGVAWVDALCTNYKYAYSNISATYATVPTYSWTVMVMTHEMGHNIGSPHTHSCTWSGGAIDNCYTPEGGCSSGPPPTNGGTVMSYCHLTSYGINLANGFGPLPGNLIRSRFNSVNCLGTCSTGGSCNVPTGLAISNITNTSATASWSAVTGATAYQARYRVTGGSWTTLAEQTGTSASLTGLSAGTTYEVQVKTVCGTNSSAFSASVTFTTTGGASCNVPTGLAVSNITTTTASVTWNAVSGAVSYDLQYKLNSSSTWSTFNTTGTAVNFTGLTANTTYNLRVRTNCASGSSNYSSTVNFTTTGQASYCTSRGNNSTYEWIDRVNLGSINNITASNGGYGNFTNLSANVTAGTTYTIILSAGMNGSYREYWNVWIDYNRDGDFTDSGERVTFFNSTSTGNISRSFTVPTNAKNGSTRMRVSMKYGSNASSCETFSYGEVEDYTVVISGGSNLPESLTNSISSVTAYPNPFSYDVTVNFEAGSIMDANLTIIDLTGKVLHTQQFETVSGLNSIPVEGLAGLQSGMYLINIKTQYEHLTAKVVKAGND